MEVERVTADAQSDHHQQTQPKALKMQDQKMKDLLAMRRAFVITLCLKKASPTFLAITRESIDGFL